jgi:hypothetical protein
MAAVKACGPVAVLSGPAAAYLWRLTKGTAPPPHVTTVNQVRPAGIPVRRTRHLDPRDTTTCRRIPITTVARTLVDIPPAFSLDALARACHEAGIRHGTTPAMVEAVLARRSNSAGGAKLRGVLRGEIKVTLSELERRFLKVLRRAGFHCPRPTGPRADAASTAAGLRTG